MDSWPSGEEGSEIMSGQTDASPTSLLRTHLFFDLPLHCSQGILVVVVSVSLLFFFLILRTFKYPAGTSKALKFEGIEFDKLHPQAI